jgi:hypothetical protein
MRMAEIQVAEYGNTNVDKQTLSTRADYLVRKNLTEIGKYYPNYWNSTV